MSQTSTSEFVVVKFENLDVRIDTWVHHFSNELATQRSYLIVQQFQDSYTFVLLKELADGPRSLILTESLPESNTSHVLITILVLNHAKPT